jgi:putative oxidoreductase
LSFGWLWYPSGTQGVNMDKARQAMAPLGRTCLAFIFLYSGVSKLFSFEGTAGYMAKQGMPWVDVFLAGAIILLIVGSLSVILGYKARWGALALIVFLVPTTLIFHAFWTYEGQKIGLQRIMFMKNLALLGGLSMVVALGAGPFSLDNRAKHSTLDKANP